MQSKSGVMSEWSTFGRAIANNLSPNCQLNSISRKNELEVENRTELISTTFPEASARFAGQRLRRRCRNKHARRDSLLTSAGCVSPIFVALACCSWTRISECDRAGGCKGDQSLLPP